MDRFSFTLTVNSQRDEAKANTTRSERGAGAADQKKRGERGERPAQQQQKDQTPLTAEQQTADTLLLCA